MAFPRWFQASLPLFAMLASVLCVAVCVPARFFGVRTSAPWVAFATLAVPWIAVANPLVTLTIVRAYRRALYGLWCRQRQQRITTIASSTAINYQRSGGSSSRRAEK